MAAFMLAIVVESFSSSVMLCSIMNCKGTMSDNVAVFSSDRTVVAFFYVYKGLLFILHQ